MKTSSFTPSNSIDGIWMLGLTSSEVYISICNMTEEYDKFNFHTFAYSMKGRTLYGKLGVEIEKGLEVSDFTTPIHKMIK